METEKYSGVAVSPLDAWRGRRVSAEKNNLRISYKNMTDYDRDCKYGEAAENDVMDILCKVFDADLCKTSRYSKIDFSSEHVDIELKSRTTEHNKYATTIVPKSKIDYIKANYKMKKYVFAFKFTDGIYYIEYDSDNFDTFECKMFVRGERTGTNDVKQLYYFIPVAFLKKVEKVSMRGVTYSA